MKAGRLYRTMRLSRIGCPIILSQLILKLHLTTINRNKNMPEVWSSCRKA